MTKNKKKTRNTNSVTTVTVKNAKNERIKKITEHPLYKKHSEKLKFLLVGGFNTLFDFVVYGLLANVIGINQIIANIVSTTICITISFFLNYNFVWKSQKSTRQTAPGFLLVSLFSAWIVQNLALKGTLLILGSADAVINLFAKLVGSACGMVSNYFGYKIVFK